MVGLDLEPELANTAWTHIISQANPKSHQNYINSQGAWQGCSSSGGKVASCADVDSVDVSLGQNAPCDKKANMQYSVIGLPGFLASFMQTAWAGERALGGATLVGGELVGIPMDEHDASSSRKKHDDAPAATSSTDGAQAGLLRHCISEPQPCRILRSCSSGSASGRAASSNAKTSSADNSGWLLLDPNAAATAFGGLTLVGGELLGVAEAWDDDDVTVTITARKVKGAKAD